MSKLTDLAPSTRTVKVKGVDIDVPGVSAAGVIKLIRRFESLKSLLASRGANVTAEQLMDLGEEAVGAIIAAGTGQPGDTEAERVANRLGFYAQLRLIRATLEETAPGGVGPLMEEVEALAALLGEDLPAADSSPSPDKTLSPQPLTSSETAATATPSGT